VSVVSDTRERAGQPEKVKAEEIPDPGRGIQGRPDGTGFLVDGNSRKLSIPRVFKVRPGIRGASQASVLTIKGTTGYQLMPRAANHGEGKT